MPTFYSEENKRKHFNAPQFTRMRHRFRGPRESEKVNLEIDQLAFSIRKLYQSDSGFRDKFVGLADLLLVGGEVEGLEDEEEDVIELEGLEALVLRAQRAMTRARSLRGPELIRPLEPDPLTVSLDEDHQWRVTRTADSISIAVGATATAPKMTEDTIGVELDESVDPITAGEADEDQIDVSVDDSATNEVTLNALSTIDDVDVSVDETEDIVVE